MGVGPRTDRRAWPQYILRRLWLTQNVKSLNNKDACTEIDIYVPKLTVLIFCMYQKWLYRYWHSMYRNWLYRKNVPKVYVPKLSCTESDLPRDADMPPMNARVCNAAFKVPQMSVQEFVTGRADHCPFSWGTTKQLSSRNHIRPNCSGIAIILYNFQWRVHWNMGHWNLFSVNSFAENKLNKV